LALSSIIENSAEKYQNNFDLLGEASLQRYLSDDNPFLYLDYKPADLEPIKSHFTYNKSYNFMLRKPAATAFADMAWAFWNYFEGKNKFFIVSAYRSYHHQKSIKAS